MFLKKRFSTRVRKSSFFLSSLVTGVFLCLFAACGSSQKTPGSATTTPRTQTENIQYAVSWDGKPDDVLRSRGISTLHISAFDVTSGKVLWKKEPATFSSPYLASRQQVVNGVLYILGASFNPNSNDQNTLLLAVDTRDGHKLWQREEKQPVIMNMSIDAGKIYLRIGKDTVKAFNASDGKPLWTYKGQHGDMDNSFLATGDTLFLRETRFVEDDPNKILQSITAFKSENGQELWRKEYYASVDELTLHLVATDQGVVLIDRPFVPYVKTGSQTAIELRATLVESGKILWQKTLPDNVEIHNVRLIDGTLYLVGWYRAESKTMEPQSVLLALDVSDGKLLWQRDSTYARVSILKTYGLYGSVVPVANSSGSSQPSSPFCSLDTATGKDRWCQQSFFPYAFSLSANKDVVVIVAITPNKDDPAHANSPFALKQKLVGLSTKDGKVLWQQAWQSSNASVSTISLSTLAEGQEYDALSLF